MNVADFESGAVTRQTTRSEGREAPLVGQFGQRIDLVHELRKLAATEEVANHGRERLRINELLRRHGFHALIEEGHALFDEALGSCEADAALVGEKFANGADAAAAEMVDVVEGTFTFFEAEKILGCGNEVGLGQDARVT